MIRSGVFQNLMDAGRFFCPDLSLCIHAHNGEQNNDETSDDSSRGGHGG